MKSKFLKLIKPVALILLVGIAFSCEEDDNFGEPTGTPAVANFEFAIDEDNSLLVHFTNSSIDADTFMWNFGDGATSTEENPSHLFTDGGTFDVSLTAANVDGEGTLSKGVTVIAPAPNLIVAGDMSDPSAWTFDQIFVGDDNGVLHGIVDGEFMWKQDEGVAFSNAYIYQEVAVEAGVPYVFGAKLRSEGTANTWFEVFMGSTMPERELDYGDDHGVKVVNISAWDACGQNPYDGDILSVCGLPENDIMVDGVITFTEDHLTENGTIYIVFKSGQWDGDFKEGIYLDDVVLQRAQ